MSTASTLYNNRHFTKYTKLEWASTEVNRSHHIHMRIAPEPCRHLMMSSWRLENTLEESAPDGSSMKQWSCKKKTLHTVDIPGSLLLSCHSNLQQFIFTVGYFEVERYICVLWKCRFGEIILLLPSMSHDLMKRHMSTCNELANYDQLLLMDNTYAYSGRFLCRQLLYYKISVQTSILYLLVWASIWNPSKCRSTYTVEDKAHWERILAEPWIIYLVLSMGGTHQERRRTTASSTASG